MAVKISEIFKEAKVCKIRQYLISLIQDQIFVEKDAFESAVKTQ